MTNTSIDDSVQEAMCKIEDWFENNPAETDILNVFNVYLPLYVRLMNECSQNQLDDYCEKYDEFYPFFQTMQDFIDKDTIDNKDK